MPIDLKYIKLGEGNFSVCGLFLAYDHCLCSKYCAGVFVILTQSEEVQLKGRPHHSICPLARCGGR